MRLKYEKVIHHAIVNNLFGFGYTKKSCNAQGSSKYYLFVTAPYSPNEIPTSFALCTISPSVSTYFNFPAVASNGICVT